MLPSGAPEPEYDHDGSVFVYVARISVSQTLAYTVTGVPNSSLGNVVLADGTTVRVTRDINPFSGAPTVSASPPRAEAERPSGQAPKRN